MSGFSVCQNHHFLTNNFATVREVRSAPPPPDDEDGLKEGDIDPDAPEDEHSSKYITKPRPAKMAPRFVAGYTIEQTVAGGEDFM